MAIQVLVDKKKKRKKFIWVVSHISIFHPTLNDSDQIDRTLKRLGIKLTQLKD